MKKKLFFIGTVLSLSFSSFAGGLLTNTNQSVHFTRNPARDASTSIDAVYTNPAGLSLLSHDGFHFSFTNQSAFQTRTITSTNVPFAGFGGSETKKFKGEASAPIIPSIQAAYKVGNWVLSGSFAISGGGGKATFNNGLPSFESNLAKLPAIIQQVGQAVPGGITADKYSVDSYMRGSSFIFGTQLGGTYKINEYFSAYGGFRLNIVNNSYEGHLRDLKSNPTSAALGMTGTMISTEPILDMAIANTTDESTLAGLMLLKKASGDGVYLDCSQTGWGISPIIGFNFNYDKLNIGMKYEFLTNLNVENKTKRDDTGMFRDGVNTPHDIPALFTLGLSYQIIPKLQASVGYHRFFDSGATMDGDKQKDAGSTNEYLAGLEYRIDKMFLVSAGGQITRYGVGDIYQRDLSYACDSYTIGFGGEVTISPKVKLNLGYFWTTYSDYTKTYEGGTKDVFSRTNKVFGAGVDFSF